VVKYVPLLDGKFRARKRSVGSSWRLDETYVKVEGRWKYLYRAVDKTGRSDSLINVDKIIFRHLTQAATWTRCSQETIL
jgi:transposase-like protein